LGTTEEGGSLNGRLLHLHPLEGEGEGEITMRGNIPPHNPPEKTKIQKDKRER